MDVNLPIALNLLPGGKLIKFGLADAFFLMTTDVTDPPNPPTTPDAMRTMYNPTNGAVSQVIADTPVYYFPYAAITGTLS